MKLRKEDIYVNLQGKSEEELKELYNLCNNDVGFAFAFDNIKEFIRGSREHKFLVLSNVSGWWVHSNSERRAEKTIQQLKEILQPKPTLQQQLEKAKAEVERLEKEVKKQNEIKPGDWVRGSISGDKQLLKMNNTHDLEYINNQSCYTKITNQQLITLLENECK